VSTLERVLTVYVDREHDGQYQAHSEGPDLGGYGETPTMALWAYVTALEALIDRSGGPEAVQ
jgi:hypothetical protein